MPTQVSPVSVASLSGAPPDLRETELTARLVAHMEGLQVPGAAMAVAHGDEEVSVAAGVLNAATGQPATPDSWFQIGSLTKVFTATLVMQLVDDRLVELDAPVRRYLSGFDVGDESASRSITVRQLLTHTSGIQGDYFADFGRGDDAVRRYVESLPQVGMLYPPGAMFSYCNSGFSVLGLMLETIRGVGFDELLAERLLLPLGIAGGTLPEQAILHRAAVGHVADKEGEPARVARPWALPRSSSPAGGTAFMDPAGLIAFARMHLAGGVTPGGIRLVSEDSAALMRSEQVALDPALGGGGIGASWIRFAWGGDTVIGHDGGTVGQYSFLRVHPESRTVLALCTNGPDGGRLYREFAQPLFAGLAGLTPPDPPVPPDDPPRTDLARLAGRYTHYGVDVDVDVAGDEVTMTVAPKANPVMGDPEQPLTRRMVPYRQGRFGVALISAEAERGARVGATFLADEGDPEAPPTHLRVGSRIHVRTGAAGSDSGS